jgi:hypothetical protein
LLEDTTFATSFDGQLKELNNLVKANWERTEVTKKRGAQPDYTIPDVYKTIKSTIKEAVGQAAEKKYPPLTTEKKARLIPLLALTLTNRTISDPKVRPKLAHNAPVALVERSSSGTN